ncbi:hypothetical protein AS593_06555 [Caulobacter vibrioides]|nr:hypothetical protein AS593_06555 [Caulobacter vibrioides]
MVLMQGGASTGVERISACWAQARSVTHTAFKPDWNRDRKAAPFRRNDALLAALPIGLLAFPRSRIHISLIEGPQARHPCLALRGARVWGASADVAEVQEGFGVFGG